MQRLGSLLLALVLAMNLAAGCGKKAADTRAGGTTGRVFGESTRRVALFFGDWQAQHLIPEERELPTNLTFAGLVAELVRELIKGPTDPTLQRTLPPDVRVLDAKVEGGVAYVNFSRELLNIRGAAAVSQALGSILLTLTDIGGIDYVQILVEGRKDAMLDEGVALNEPMGRPFYGDMPYAPNPDRVRYLQEVVTKQNKQLWRTEAISVVRFDGRGFGFPASQLELAYVVISGNVAQARVSYRGTTYLIHLTRNTEVQENGVWTISKVTSHRVEAGEIGRAFV